MPVPDAAPAAGLTAPPNNVAAPVVETMGRRIVSGHYPVGGKLPSEHELCAEFGVSRPILREVFKVLSAKGLIRAHPRIGSLVQERTDWTLLDRDVLEWTTHALPEAEFLDMIFGVRMVFEPQAAALAAQQATDEEIAALGAALAAMESAPDVTGMLDPDLAFHEALAEATHNALISYIARTLHVALAASFRLTGRHPDSRALALPRHRAVYEAIAARNPQAASAATLALLTESRTDFDALGVSIP